jgi:hypothetical protein
MSPLLVACADVLVGINAAALAAGVVDAEVDR